MAVVDNGNIYRIVDGCITFNIISSANHEGGKVTVNLPFDSGQLAIRNPRRSVCVIDIYRSLISPQTLLYFKQRSVSEAWPLEKLVGDGIEEYRLVGPREFVVGILAHSRIWVLSVIGSGSVGEVVDLPLR